MYIIFVVITLLIFGLVLVFPAAQSICLPASENFCVISQMFIKLPTWIGTFIGVFVSASLAYKLSIKKQNQDDINKQKKDEYKKLNKLQVLASNCFSDIAAIKFTYLQRISDNKSISRAMLHPYMVSAKTEPVKFDAENYYFLIPDGKSVDQVSLRNPNYLSNIFHRYNAVVALYETRNELAREIHNNIVEHSLDSKQYGSIITFDIDSVAEQIGLNRLLNYIQLSEKLYTEIDLCIDELSMFSFELPHVANHCFKSMDSPYRLREIDSRTEFNKPLFKPLPQIDVTSEINKILKEYKTQHSRNWRPDNYVEFN